MQTIHKFVLEHGVNEIETYEGAQVLSVANQNGVITVWILVRLDSPKTKTIHIVVRYTGEDYDYKELSGWERFIGTVLLHNGAEVNHVFEICY